MTLLRRPGGPIPMSLDPGGAWIAMLAFAKLGFATLTGRVRWCIGHRSKSMMSGSN
jgi:hypothetical protein